MSRSRSATSRAGSPRGGVGAQSSACETYWVGGGLLGVALALRALPFAVLRTLRDSALVRQLSLWMPVGILAILAVTALHGTIAAEPHATLYALLAVAVTAAVHLASGRRTILSVGIGTAVYALVNDPLTPRRSRGEAS
ncbi:AzlD domain-containing protein [Streptomyces himalayensis]|uniref:AzlD domain-containing protein n=1 Tax=Streptomyces himalayensis subsp. himalayensis TaxID=2756131 RepID=A0A7W0I7Y3_9ACTN|nr:AzlD domain-containing protein [Streptomyces himalayensis]MBA2945692.1 AzlD domain-containing protein [Streptomyces himalayensis subsp. himalayensis]